MTATAKPVSKESPAKQLAGFIARFDPAIAKIARASRAALRKQFPTANELVYDNYQALAIGFCTTERASNCMFSVVVMARGVGLSFYYGSTLPDPHKILLGSGNQNRFVRLESSAVLAKTEVQELLRAAVKQAKVALPKTGKGRTIIKSISAKQLPRRPATRE
jgi:hypothetical protein